MTREPRVPNPGFTPDERYLENIIPTPRPLCELPGGCRHRHVATNGVRFIIVRVDGAPTRLCGGCWEALLERRGREHNV